MEKTSFLEGGKFDDLQEREQKILLLLHEVLFPNIPGDGKLIPRSRRISHPGSFPELVDYTSVVFKLHLCLRSNVALEL